MLLVVAAVAYYYAGGYAAKVSAMKTEAVSMVSHSSKDTFRKSQTSIAYDINGKTLSVLKGEKDVYYIEYEDIPIYVKQAIISTEDKRFYKHKGIDYRGIMRAVVAMIQDGEVTQGGSTITQQLVKNMYYDQNKTFARKAAEAWTALYVERQLSKEEILELYINTIYFGDGYYGLKEASLGYFGKEPQELTDSEAVLLAGIPNAPSAYAPSRHADLALQREKQVLAAMVKYGYLEQSETDSLLWDAAADPVLAR